MQRSLTRLLCLLAAFLLSACGKTDGFEEILPFSIGGAGTGRAYAVSIEGEITPDLRKLLEANSQLYALKDEAPTSEAALRRRIRADTDGLRSVLRSEGYYGGTVSATTDEQAQPLAVRLMISPGRQYRVGSFEISYTGDRVGEEGLPIDAAAFGFVPDMPARGTDIVAVSDALLERLARSGRPLAHVADRKGIVDHDTAIMTVRLLVDPGPPARFGPLEIAGLDKVEEGYVRQILNWPEGQTYDRRVLDQARRTLAATNLFRSISIEPAQSVTPEGSLPVDLAVTEAKHRTIAAGINYSTDEGVGGELSWEHRNLLGRQERLRLSAEASQIRQEGSVDFRKPEFLQRDLTLHLNGTGRAQDTDAYDEKTASGFVGLEKRFRRIWTAEVGVTTEYSRIDEDGVESIYGLVGLPLSAIRDGTDNLLDPREGTRLHLSVTPYFATIENDVGFTMFEATGSVYFGLGKERRLVPALRTRIGSIIGADTLDIPITKRFFAGGGGSVRGYEFQKAGPLDADGDPVGGRSVLEAGLELRWQATEKIGFVPFVEGGNVYDDTSPDFGEDLFWAAGIGLRYFTIAGPIRLDVAFPLNKRDGFDDDYQYYISLGQAF